ncbi:hypothetical protein [Parabacteroides sp.]
MKIIKRSFFLLLFVFSFISCSTDNDEELIEKKTYEFSTILWSLQEGDGEEFFDVKMPEQVFRNTDNTTKDITINPYKNINETSLFYIDEKVLNDLPEEGIFITIPTTANILSSDYGYLVGNRKAPFYNNEEILPPSKIVKDILSLAPSCELRTKSTITMKKITATYRIYFVEKGGSDSYEVEGKWEGKFIFGDNSETIISEIK